MAGVQHVQSVPLAAPLHRRAGQRSRGDKQAPTHVGASQEDVVHEKCTGNPGAFLFAPYFAGLLAVTLCPEPINTTPCMELLWLSLASLLAGFVDAIVGGGGLLLVPALIATFPATHPATLFGVNKGASIWGTAFATWHYSRRVQLRWDSLWPAALAGFGGSLGGAWLVTVISQDFLRKVLPLVLLAVLIYTLAKKELGRAHTPRFSGRAEILAACTVGVALGFYDGFFGPGTGSFLVFLLVRWLGYDFLHASASAKLINTATNLAALILFAIKGMIWWQFALIMGTANVAGSLLGTRMALKHGTGFVRIVFILVVSALIFKTGYDAFLR